MLHRIDISRRVGSFTPIGNIKGYVEWTRVRASSGVSTAAARGLHAARGADRVGRAPRGRPRGAHHLAEARAPDRPRAEEGLRGPHVLRVVGRSDPACELAAPRGARHKAKKTP